MLLLWIEQKSTAIQTIAALIAIAITLILFLYQRWLDWLNAKLKSAAFAAAVLRDLPHFVAQARVAEGALGGFEQPKPPNFPMRASMLQRIDWEQQDRIALAAALEGTKMLVPESFSKFLKECHLLPPRTSRKLAELILKTDRHNRWCSELAEHLRTGEAGNDWASEKKLCAGRIADIRKIATPLREDLQKIVAGVLHAETSG